MAKASGTGLVIGAGGGLVLGAVMGNAGIGLIFGSLAGIVFGARFAQFSSKINPTVPKKRPRGIGFEGRG